MRQSSGVGVVDKCVAVLSAVQEGPCSLATLTDRTGLSRATAHRLALALETHRILDRDGGGRWVIGPWVADLGALARPDPLRSHALPVLTELRDRTGESAQVYVRDGDSRVCLVAAERGSGLRDTVPEGSHLPLTAGSAAQVLLAWDPSPRVARLLVGAAFSARTLADVRRRGWAQSIAQRESGVASVSAPVRGPTNVVIAALSVSGPIERLTRSPGQRHAANVTAAAAELTRLVGGTPRAPVLPVPATQH